MKKTICLMLALLLVFKLNVLVYANGFCENNEDENFLEFAINLKPSGVGSYIVIENNYIDNRMNDNLNSYENNKEIIRAYPTKDEDIFKVDENNYMLKVNNREFMPMEKIKLESFDEKFKEEIFEYYKIPSLIVKEINDTITKQKQIGNSKLEIEIYVPRGFDNERFSYYTYNGYEMRDWLIKYVHSSIYHTWSGDPNLVNFSRSWVDFIVNIAGITIEKFNPFTNIYGTIVSALDAFENSSGPVVYGSSNDWLQFSIMYDSISKTTQVYNPMVGWQTGVTSQKIWLDRFEAKQYYNSNGKSHNTITPLNREVYTDNYRDPRQLATIWYKDWGYHDPPIKTKINNTTFVFTNSGK